MSRLTRTHGHSLDLSLSLHEDKFPLPGESPLQPGEVFLEEPIRRGVRGRRLFEFKALAWLHYPFTVMACHNFGLLLLRWDHLSPTCPWTICFYHTVFAVPHIGTVFVYAIIEVISVTHCILYKEQCDILGKIFFFAVLPRFKWEDWHHFHVCMVNM